MLEKAVMPIMNFMSVKDMIAVTLLNAKAPAWK